MSNTKIESLVNNVFGHFNYVKVYANQFIFFYVMKCLKTEPIKEKKNVDWNATKILCSYLRM